MTKILVWNEGIHEKEDKVVQDIYPEGIHGAIAGFLKQHDDFTVKTATLDMPEHGLTEETLAETDVLIWWGHKGHHLVDDAIVERVYNRVLCGMGLIVLHSAHFSKIFKKLMGTACTLSWRAVGESERLWVVDPTHPIAQGLPPYFELEAEEMYGEFFDIPAPDELVMIGWFKGGEVFRSGCCFKRGYGKVFYFQPGHETYPTYRDKNIQQVIANSVRWATPGTWRDGISAPKVDPLERLG